MRGEGVNLKIGLSHINKLPTNQLNMENNSQGKAAARTRQKEQDCQDKTARTR
jgi:hypothetical protein